MSLLSALAVVAALQTLTVCEVNCQVRIGSPFVAFTEAEPTATGYRMIVNGVARTDVNAQVANGFIEFTFAQGLPTAGSYSLVIQIVMPGGTVLSTDPNTLTVVKRKVRVKG